MVDPRLLMEIWLFMEVGLLMVHTSLLIEEIEHLWITIAHETTFSSTPQHVAWQP